MQDRHDKDHLCAHTISQRPGFDVHVDRRDDKRNEDAMSCQQGHLEGSYNFAETDRLVQARHHLPIAGAFVLVLGSERPWVEASALGLGATHITTVEYGGITSTHPQIRTLTPHQIRARFHEFIEHFDVVISYSSIEHSGLGRHGDALNPWGDRQAVARAWCMAKHGGRLAMGLPHNETDTNHYNAHHE